MAAIPSSLLFLLFLSLVGLASCDEAALQDKCAPLVPKLMECLDYATAKSVVPTAQCCSSTSNIRNKDPVCLCYIIQQTSNGGASTKSLGLQIDRLIQLPGACKLANSSASDCPKLLKLSPSSPDNAIFSNATKATTPSMGSANANIKSAGVMQHIKVSTTFAISVVSSIFLSIFSV